MPPFMPPVVDPLLVVPPVVVPRPAVVPPVVWAIATPGMINATAATDVRIRILLSCLINGVAFRGLYLFQKSKHEPVNPNQCILAISDPFATRYPHKLGCTFYSFSCTYLPRYLTHMNRFSDCRYFGPSRRVCCASQRGKSLNLMPLIGFPFA